MKAYSLPAGGMLRLSFALVLSLVLLCAVSLPYDSIGHAQIGAPPDIAPSRHPTGAVPEIPGDEYWASGFHLPGMDSPVFSLAAGQDGSLYVGGEFTTASGVVASRIVRWDGSQWQTLGSGMNGSVRALVVGPDGSLYAGGEFTTAGGVSGTQGIARWDGSAWYPLDGGVDGNIYALAAGPNGTLYAGGSFPTAGGVTASNVARWDGAAWHPLGSGTDGEVSALTIGSNGLLYAGGSFTTAGGVSASAIARWDGTAWYALGSGMNQYSTVLALAIGSGGSLYAGGGFTTAGGVTVNRIARWDGATWHALGSGMNQYSYVRAFAVGQDGSLYASGDFTTAGGVAANYVARWDGTAWHPLGSGVGGDPTPNVHALITGSNGSIYTGGRFTTADGVAASRIARWEPATSSWHAVGRGNGMNYGIFALARGANGSLYAGGDFSTAGEIVTNGIARWDMTTSSWYSVGGGMGGEYPFVEALAVSPSGSLYAGGGFTSAGGVAALRIARWDGTTWHSLVNQIDDAVYALAVGTDESFYAGGLFTTVNGVTVNRIARWNGTSWNALGTGVSGGLYGSSVKALEVGPDGSLYVGGNFTNAGGVAANRIARWDGSSWHALGSGLSGSGQPMVNALAFGRDGSLYVGGQFTSAGGVAATNIARWDGSQWYPLGSQMNGTVEVLAVGADGSLYAGGNFTSVGGVAALYLARWDGVAWHPLGSGAGGSYIQINGLELGLDGTMYAGGFFTTAGDTPSSAIARWMAPCCDYDGDGTVDVDDVITIAGLWNQPGSVPYELDGDGWITIVDLQRVTRWWGAWVP